MRRLWAISLACSLCLSPLVWAAGRLGERLRRIPAVLENLNTCETPCWFGIVPGLDTWNKANALLRDDGYLAQGDYGYRFYALSVYLKPTDAPNCTVSLEVVPVRDQLVISTIFLNNCRGFTLGDLLAAIGQPHEILPRGLSSGTETLAGASLSFRDGRVIARRRGELRPGQPWFSPDTEVGQIEIHGQSAVAFLSPTACRYGWQGFKPQSHYQVRSSGLC